MRLIRFLILITLTALYSCIGVDEVDLSSPTNIKIELDNSTKNMSSEMTLGEARFLKATYFNVHAREEGVNLVWVSSDENVLKVDQDSVRAVGVGEALVYATFQGIVSDSTNKITVSAISISVDETNIISGGTKQVTLDIAASLKDKTITWKSSDETVATIDANGKITSLKKGSTDISATVEGITSNIISINVVEGFFISITNRELLEGITEEAKITIDKTLEGQTVTWKSSDETVATIDANGKITAKTAGTTTISAEINSNISNTITITVNALPSRTGNLTAPGSYRAEGTVTLEQTLDGKLQIVFQDDAFIQQGPSLYLLLAEKEAVFPEDGDKPKFVVITDGNDDDVAINQNSAQITAKNLPSSISGKTIYEVPEGIEIDDYDYVVLYCVLGPVFGQAELK